jgi:hypothetical protein
MKYRYLTDDELKILEDELVQFLIVNGIDGAEWKRINEEQPKRALELVGVFSDLVIERSIEKIRFGEITENNQYFIFAFHSDDIELIGARTINKSCTFKSFEALLEMIKSDSKNIELFSQTKKYSPNRSDEIFRMLNNGLLLSEQNRFELLKKLYHND